MASLGCNERRSHLIVKAITMGRVAVSAIIESIEDLYRVQRGELSADQVRRTIVPDALIDTGATNLSLPERVVRELGLLPITKRRAMTPTGIREVATYGAVKLTVAGRDCVCDVTEIPDECPVLIGQVPLELLDFVVDPTRRKLVGNPAHGGEQMIELLCRGPAPLFKGANTKGSRGLCNVCATDPPLPAKNAHTDAQTQVQWP